jgi:acetylornithine deacetylase
MNPTFPHVDDGTVAWSEAVIAIDVRATSCRGVLADLTGAVLAEDYREPVAPTAPTGALLACLRRLRHAALAAEATVTAIGIGVPSSVAVSDHVLDEHVSEPLIVRSEIALPDVIAAAARMARSLPRRAAPGARPSALPAGVRERILREVAVHHALALLRDFVATPSITGSEMVLGGIVVGELHALGFDRVVLDEIAPGRANAWGRIARSGDGDGLLLVGNLDTVDVDGWAGHWRGDEREDPFSAAVVDGELWGRGALSGKSGIAAALAALWVLSRAGLKPRAGLTLAGVADRETGGPGLGASAGMTALAGQIGGTDLPRPDFAVYLDPTRLAVCTAQVGVLVAELAGSNEQAVRHALEAHAATLAGSATHPLSASPSLAVSDHGGRVRVVRRVVAGERLDDAAAALEEAVASAAGEAGVAIDVAYPGCRDHPLGGRPFEVSPGEPGVERLRAAVRTVRPDRGQVRGAPSWSELSFLTGLGIPGAYFSAGDVTHRYGVEERVDVEEFADAVRALALFIAEHCGVQEVGPSSQHADAR